MVLDVCLLMFQLPSASKSPRAERRRCHQPGRARRSSGGKQDALLRQCCQEVTLLHWSPRGPEGGPSHLYGRQERPRRPGNGEALPSGAHSCQRAGCGERRPVSLIKGENVAGSQTLNLIRPCWWKTPGQVWHRDPHLSPAATPLLALAGGRSQTGTHRL